MTSGAADTRGTSGAALVWAVGMLGYVLAVMQRTTFGVAGLRRAVRSATAPTAAATAMAVQQAVRSAWAEPLEDDATLVVLAVD